VQPRGAGGVPSGMTAATALDRDALDAELDEQGFALTPPLVDADACDALIAAFDDPGRWRSTVVMDRHGYGRGTYRYFRYPLPDAVAALRAELYPPLAAVANRWAAQLGGPAFPADHGELLARCRDAGQTKPTPLVLRYGPGDYNCLHQDVYGDVTFPLQVAVALTEPDEDFTGGENVFVEQRPRAQSRAGVARPRRGEGLVFAVRERPVAGARGPKKVMLRHGVSTVRTGRRLTLGIIFHDA
jgi:uncharacterized protein